ncbi:MAG: tetratricopeptide repeat protein, partial [Saprospiraceae bacterium]
MNYLTLLLCCLWAAAASAQTNFRAGWEVANPVAKDSKLPLEEKIKTHQIFLEKAILEGSELKQLYGQLYLMYDYFNLQDYPGAAGWLVKAEALANNSGNLGWQGWVMHRKGVLAMRMKNYAAAKAAYQKATALCSAAGDSLCLAEGLEQLSIATAGLDDFDLATRYHLEAMPLIEKYGGQAQLASAMNNYGTINYWQNKHQEAISCYTRAIAIYQSIGLPGEAVKPMNNLAAVYKATQHYDQALAILDTCIRINLALHLPGNLKDNYGNLSDIYDSMHNYRAAFQYLILYDQLIDSITGTETQQKINELEIKYQSQQKELELEKSKGALESARRALVWRTAILLFGLLLAGIGLWRWRLQSRFAQHEISRNQESLAAMTRLLLEKNTQLAEMKAAAQSLVPTDPKAAEPADELNLFENRILTEADWASFKIYFEKAHP